MDKQMIEEMAKIMDIDCGECYTCDYYDKHDKGLPANCTCFLQARELYNAGYRKIPEGAVVLTREEYEELKKGIKTYNYTAMFDAQSAYRWEQGYLQGAKEAAEKFAEMAREGAFVDFMGEPIIRASKIDEICKGITEGK